MADLAVALCLKLQDPCQVTQMWVACSIWKSCMWLMSHSLATLLDHALGLWISKTYHIWLKGSVRLPTPAFLLSWRLYFTCRPYAFTLQESVLHWFKTQVGACSFDDRSIWETQLSYNMFSTLQSVWNGRLSTAWHLNVHALLILVQCAYSDACIPYSEIECLKILEMELNSNKMKRQTTHSNTIF